MQAQVHGGNLIEDAEKNPPTPRLLDNYRVDFNRVESEGPLVLPFLPPGHTYMVTTNIM